LVIAGQVVPLSALRGSLLPSGLELTFSVPLQIFAELRLY